MLTIIRIRGQNLFLLETQKLRNQLINVFRIIVSLMSQSTALFFSHDRKVRQSIIVTNLNLSNFTVMRLIISEILSQFILIVAIFWAAQNVTQTHYSQVVGVIALDTVELIYSNLWQVLFQQNCNTCQSTCFPCNVVQYENLLSHIRNAYASIYSHY